MNPQIFDDLSVFQSWFGFKDIGQKKQGATDEAAILLEQRENQTVTKLHEILRPFLLRRIKTDVLSEMPPKKEVSALFFDMTNRLACVFDSPYLHPLPTCAFVANRSSCTAE